MKTFVITLILLTALSFATTAIAYDFMVDSLAYNINDSTVSVTYTHNNTSDNYSGLTTANIPDSVTHNGETYPVVAVDHSAFSGCSSLVCVTIPNSVTSIGNYAFSGCSSLVSITIPNSVTSIGDLAFWQCTGLTNIDIQNSIMGYGQFCDCTSLSSVTIPVNITAITNSAFFGCTSLTSITIPNSVTSIGATAFSGCTSLTIITIPKSIQSIGLNAFKSCINLNKVIWNAILCNSTVQLGCYNIVSFEFGDSVERIPDGLCFGMEKITNIAIPNKVTSIGWAAFSGCKGLSSITIPKSVTTIDINPFTNCSNLETIVVEKGNPTFDSRNNCNAIIETKTNTLISGCKNSTIPNTITALGNSAFWGCAGLTNITIPNAITTIGNCTFYECKSLTNITIPNTIKSIERLAFYNCTELSVINSVVANPDKVEMGSDVFKNVPKESCALHVPKGTESLYRESDQWKDFTNIIDDPEAPFTPGDVNGDESVNVSDVTTLVNMILGIVDKDEQAADMNGDGQVNVSDVTALINIILGVK